MAFLINDTGIEDYATGSPQVVFASPVIIMDRDDETTADVVYDVSLTGAPVCVVYDRTQAKTFLKIYTRLVTGADLTALRALMTAGKIVNVKLEAGDATVIPCMFGPRDQQKLVPWNGPHPDAKGDGDPIPDLLLQYKAELMLLRMS